MEYDWKALSDAKLIRFADQIGREIDRRWSLRSRCHFRHCGDVFEYFHFRLWHEKQENLYLLLLDAQHHLIEEVLVSVGTLDASLIHAREVFAPAIEKRAAYLVLIHNHPSGIATPSSADLSMTRRLKKISKMIGIHLLDHVIIGKNQYFSDALGRIIL
ncbi:MAG: JAB domain-containing protein [Deltaproteobacteria bacterium]|nr:JAB domain-containing protein [Deltaproteobacteria bacterium]